MTAILERQTIKNLDKRVVILCDKQVFSCQC